MVNMSAKFDEEAHNGVVANLFTSLFLYMSILTFWPVTSKINRVYSLIMLNMSAKFNEEAHKGLVCIMFTSLFPHM